MKKLSHTLMLLLCVGVVQAEPQLSNTKISVKDNLGADVGWAKVDLIQRGTRKTNTAKFRVDEGCYDITVPYGAYILSVEAEGMQSHRQRVRIHQPQTYFRVGAAVSKIDGAEPIVLSGRINIPYLQHSERWVTLIPILANDTRMDYKLDSSGAFRFTDIELGQYILVVTELPPESGLPPRIVSMRNVAVSKSSQLTLDLPR